MEFVLVAFSMLILVIGWQDAFQRAVLLTIVCESMGVLYYVARGVDNLDFDYVIVYFATVPGFVIGMAAYSAIERSRPAIFLVIAGAGALWATRLLNDPGMPDYNSPGIAELDQAMDRLGPRRVALSLVNTHDWRKVWATMLGVEAKRIREGRELGFCIADNWHISMAQISHCGPSDANLERITVDVDDAPNREEARVLFTAGGLEFFKTKTLCLSPGSNWPINEYSITINAATTEGWSDFEKDFKWSLGKTSYINICAEEGVRAVDLDLGAFLPSAASQQHLTVHAADESPIDFDFDSAHPTRRISVPLPPGHPRRIQLVLDLPDAVSPAQAELSDDKRELAVSLRGVGAE